ncbi:MAG: hypothetical protein BWY93_02314 [Euryarchaeota archaeon ADurb.BinA087]|nr:MAG: hypothetical protein BWY93_02314 [Euryarchaeota archaeon ADurb.BinA087]
MEKYCPMTYTVGCGFVHKCSREGCAWYDERANQCGVLTIARRGKDGDQ